MSVASFLLLAALATAASPVDTAPQTAVLVDAVEAVVDRAVITRSDVRAEVFLQLRAQGVTFAPSAIDERLRAAVREHLIVRELLVAEARRAGQVPPPIATPNLPCNDDACVSQARLLGVDEAFLLARARREALVAAHLEVALHDAGQVTDAEVEAERLNNTTGIDDARATLLAARRQRALAALVTRLLQNADVWRVAP